MSSKMGNITAGNQFSSLEEAVDCEASLDLDYQWKDPIALVAPMPQCRAFPSEVFPKPYRDLLDEIDQCYGLPDGMAGSALLGVASIACQKTARLAIKEDHLQFAGIYICIVAPSGAGKTPLTMLLKHPLIMWEKEQLAAHRDRFYTWKANVDIALAEKKVIERVLPEANESEKDEIREKLKSINEIISSKPTEPRLLVEDFTGEALAAVIKENEGFLGVLSEDARNIFKIATGKNNRRGDVSLLLRGHAGNDHWVDRKDSEPILISNVVLSIVAMLQPDCLPMLTKDSAIAHSGLLARFEFVVPDEKPFEYPVEAIPKEVLANYEKAIRNILEAKPETVAFDQKNRSLWKAFHDSIKRDALKYKDSNPLFFQWLNKQPEQIARFALILFRLKTLAGEKPLLFLQILDAFQLFKFFESHALRAFTIVEKDAGMVILQRIWNWIDGNRSKLSEARLKQCGVAIEAVNARDLQVQKISGVQNAKHLKYILKQLVEFHYLRPITATTLKKGTTSLFLIRPDVTG
jgi:hypothetical protein